jgi:hypothetical protein
MVTVPRQHIEWIKEEIKNLKEMLESLESGKVHIGEHKPNQPWQDRTQAWIDHLRRTIAMYETLVDTRDA